MSIVFLIAVGGIIARGWGNLPDVDVDSKSAPNSPLALKEVAQRGRNNYKATGTAAAANLTANEELRMTLDAEAAKSQKGISGLTLRRIAAIESKCDLDLAYSKPLVRGYFQMNEAACTDVSIPFADIKEKTAWKKGCEAGRKFLDLNWKRLEDEGLTLSDGTKATLTVLYLWHQQGSGAAPKLLKNLADGTAKGKAANDNMRANVGPQALASIDGPATGGHKMTELEYYAYWAGAIDATIEAIK